MRPIATLVIAGVLISCRPQPVPNSPRGQHVARAEVRRPDIHYFHGHSLEDAEAIEAAEALAQRLEKYGMHWHRNNSIITFWVSGGVLGGTRGTLSLTTHGVEVSIFNFPGMIPRFLAVPRVEREIRSHFKIIGE